MNASRREIPESVINNPNLKTPPPIAGVTPGASASNPSALTIANPADLELAENINSAMQQMNPVSGFTRKAVGPNYSVNLQGVIPLKLVQIKLLVRLGHSAIAISTPIIQRLRGRIIRLRNREGRSLLKINL